MEEKLEDFLNEVHGYRESVIVRKERETASGLVSVEKGPWSFLTDAELSFVLRTAEELLRVGADPNAVCESGVTPMHLAAGLDLTSICLLLQHGGDPNVRLQDETTPVHVAAMWGKLDCVQILLANGGDPLLRDQDGLSSHDLAVQYNHKEVVHILDYYIQLLSGSVDQTTTPQYTYKRVNESILSGPDRDSSSSSDASYNTALDSTYRSSSDGPLDVALCHTQESLEHNPEAKKRGRRSSVYLKSVQSQMDRFFRDGQKTHVVDVTSPDHPYVEMKTAERIPDQLNNTPVCTPPTTIKNRQYSIPTEETTKNPWQQSKCGYKQSGSRGDKYCSRTLFSPLKYVVEDNVLRCDYCGCEREDVKWRDGNVCSTCDKLDTELDQLTLQYNVDREKYFGIPASFCVENSCRNSSDDSEFIHGLDVPTLNTDLSPEENRGESEKLCTRNRIKYRDEKLYRDINPSDREPPDVHTSLISEDQSFQGRQSVQDVGQGRQMSRFHPSDISDISVTDGGNDISPEMNDLWSQVRDSNQKRKKLLTVKKTLDNAFIGRESGNSTVYSDASTVDYVYTDEENGIMLIERHIPSLCGSAGSRRSLNSTLSGYTQTSNDDVCRRSSPQGQGHSVPFELSARSEDTVLYDWQAELDVPSLGVGDVDSAGDRVRHDFRHLDNRDVRSRLVGMGDAPGPVTKTTRQMYLKRLSQIEGDGKIRLTQKGPGYPPELCLALDGHLDMSDMAQLEVSMVSAFQNPSPARRWREGTLKSSFNYILLDPRITCDLPNRANNMGDKETFVAFIKAIFYVGKGKRSRPYSHLYEAIKQMKKTGSNSKTSNKVQKILDIWSSGLGVVSLHCFQSVIPVEAYTREGCMVDAIGLPNLTNMKRGDYYGVSTTYAMKQRRKIGVYLLSKALKIFLADGERQISPPDIKQ